MADVHLHTNTVLLLRCMTAAVRVKLSLSSGWSSGLIATVGSFELLSNNFRCCDITLLQANHWCSTPMSLNTTTAPSHVAQATTELIPVVRELPMCYNGNLITYVLGGSKFQAMAYNGSIGNSWIELKWNHMFMAENQCFKISLKHFIDI